MYLLTYAFPLFDFVNAATPWSAPSWLKEWNSLIAWSNDNTLINSDAAYNTYAQYFAKTIAAFRQQGIAIQYVTLQNEPLFGDSSQYPGMYFESWQAAKLGTCVGLLFTWRAVCSLFRHRMCAHCYFFINPLQASWCTSCSATA